MRKQLISKLSQIVSRDLGNRGIGKLIEKYTNNSSDSTIKQSELYCGNEHSIGKIVDEFIMPKVDCQKDVISNKYISIITGFSVPPNGFSENDGPLGAIWIGLGIVKYSNLNVLYFVDENQYNAISKFANMVFESMKDRIKIVKITKSDLDNVKQSSSISECIENIDSMISIERVGKTKDSNYYSMRGIDISSYNLSMDRLIDHVREIKPETQLISIGDGGNEIGMGNVIDGVAQFIPNGDKIACAVKCNQLLICGVSNWGGYLLYLLFEHCNSSLTLQTMQGINIELDRSYLEYMNNECKMVDGVRNQPTMSVDGLEYDLVHANILKELNECFQSSNQ
ncbi:predicted protein [Naegleria gruberi]|uniref:Predicted protein n=1 Tax=Naegleria gruberi TaxID=5762 RepID=D2VFN9_NAEGR|nr:uncharacterized protein NAEGRDRAFT_67691 [Naegleria gruberi]EFC44391.1 predicted protein [Naegleria gruberi]|eukprot:XP_002677135.1 predicted protein [Naegleria gruberi strain NEG-M]